MSECNTLAINCIQFVIPKLSFIYTISSGNLVCTSYTWWQTNSYSRYKMLRSTALGFYLQWPEYSKANSSMRIHIFPAFYLYADKADLDDWTRSANNNADTSAVQPTILRHEVIQFIKQLAHFLTMIIHPRLAVLSWVVTC